MIVFDSAPQLFCDMDGVLTDFVGSAAKYLGFEWRSPQADNLTDHEKWDLLLKLAPPNFWEEMPWICGGQRLWLAIQRLDPIILTAPAKRQTECMGQKITWCERNLQIEPWRVVIKPAIRKQDYAVIEGVRNILIDDGVLNCEQWAKRGGHAVLHKNVATTLAQLGRWGVLI